MCQIDRILAKEICGLPLLIEATGERDAQENLIPEEDYAKIKANSTTTLQRYETLDFKKVTLSQVVEELTKPPNEYVTRWQSTATALSRIQSRFIPLDSKINNVEYCRNRVETPLKLAASAVRRLTHIALELRDFDAQLLFAIQFQLSTLQAFEPIWEMLTSAEGKMPRDMTRGVSALTIELRRLEWKLEKDEKLGLDYTSSKHRVSSY